MKDTDIEIGSIWVRDGFKHKVYNTFYGTISGFFSGELIAYIGLDDECHVLTKKEFLKEFLKDFTHCKPVYKYQYACKVMNCNAFNAITSHLTDEEAADLIEKYPEACYQKIEASKIEA